MDTVHGPRPAVDTRLHLVVLRDPDVEVLGATLRFDRGRGMIVEAEGTPPVPFRKGDRVLMAYAGGEDLYALRGVVSEVLAPTRVYILPGPAPVRMEKREYIRAVVQVQALLTPGAKAPQPEAPMTRTSVELSASGFRWFGQVKAATGDAAVLSLRLDNGNGIRLDLPATVVRAEACGDSFEVAGRFGTVPSEVREAILDVVFRRRLAGLGLDAGRSWNEDP